MRNLLISLLVIFSFTEISSQTINIKIKNLNHETGQLSYLKGENFIKTDSIISIDQGNFRFTFPKNSAHLGFYRLILSNGKWVDFVNDDEDISITTDANNMQDSISILKSESNKLYYQFLKLNKQYKVKTDLLQFVLAKYPKDDNYYALTKNKLLQLQKDYAQFVYITSQKNPQSFIARYIKSVQITGTDTNLPIDKQLAYLKAHCLDKVDYSDDDLINSDAFTVKSIEYLTLFRNPQLTKDMLEKEFMTAVDTILNKAKVNKLVYQHVTEYLIDGFKKFGFDHIIDYIVDNYVIKDDLCLDEKLTNSIQRRMDQARYLKIGSVVPPIVIPDSTGKSVDLNDIKAENTLILFYASWCPHCQELLPKLNDLYKSQKQSKLKIMAISIDTSKTDWLNFIQKNKFNWTNVSDLQGWNGKAATDYYLYATPTMFIVNNKKEIIAKPLNIDDISKFVE